MQECHGKVNIDFSGLKKIALVGNPNVGKSVIFSHLTGMYVTVSNYPGTTVEMSRGAGTINHQKFEVIDTPGMNSVIPSSEDEKVARDLLLNERPDIVIQVADAKNLRRTLLLTLQLQAMGFPLILNLNMMDEAEQRRIDIDVKKLSDLLGVVVIATIATDGIGVCELKAAIGQVAKTGEKYKPKPLPDNAKEVRERQRREIDIYDTVVKKMPRGTLFLERLGDFTIHPLTGLPVLFFVLWLLYQVVGVWAAGNGVGFMEDVVFGEYINPWAIKLADLIIPLPLIKEFFVGEYGVITMALSYAIAIILPILSAFFLFFSILEDSGYLPRLAILLNRSFRVIGLSGKAVIPMVLGLGCDTMATMTTRTLDTQRERIIATLLLALAIPCSAQLGVILGMIGGLSAKATMIWAGVVIFIFFLTGYLAARILPGKSSDFIMEIPPIRLPKLKNILVKTMARIEWYLKEAVPLFIIGTMALFVFDKIQVLELIENLASPLVVSFMGLPAKATEAFLIGFFRRDYGAAGLYALAKAGLLSPTQIVVSLVTITLFIPCLAQLLVMIKERGARTAFYIVAFIFPFAFLVGGILNFILRYFKVAL
ncbi:ferrous iron transporter B [Candidatus Saganbacteria bacterium]|nr:ferrous iron transporter B [Candidatus Saganbacteria bacterium]